MAEYIEREKVIHEIGTWLDSVGTVLVGKGLSYYGELLGCVEDVPAADVAPVRHGRWIMRGGKLHCSNCEDLAPLKRGWEDGCTTYEYTASRWCPNCGVKMGGGETP